MIEMPTLVDFRSLNDLNHSKSLPRSHYALTEVNERLVRFGDGVRAGGFASITIQNHVPF